jgi:hypothetical protein
MQRRSVKCKQKVNNLVIDSLSLEEIRIQPVATELCSIIYRVLASGILTFHCARDFHLLLCTHRAGKLVLFRVSSLDNMSKRSS